jgi:hypothetical protein
MFVLHQLADVLQFPACAFDVALRLPLLFVSHLHRCFGHPAAGTMQNHGCCLQFSLQCCRLCCCRCWWLSLGSQKQLRMGKNALANHA